MVIEIILGLICLGLLGFIFKQNKQIASLGTHLEHLNELKAQNCALEQKLQAEKDHIQTLGDQYKKKARPILRGQIAEELCPFQDNFPYQAQDLVFLGNSVDFIVFKNLDHFRDTGQDIDQVEIVFLEIKTGYAQLSPVQQAIKAAIENHRVRFDVYNQDRIMTSLQILDFSLDDQEFTEFNHKNLDEKILQIRQNFARHRYVWPKKEDQLLKDNYEKGYSIEDLSYMSQRTTSAIEARLEKWFSTIKVD